MKRNEPEKTVLIVDDEVGFLESLSEGLEDQEYSVQTASSARAALDVLAADNIDLLVTDLNMPGMSGFELVGNIGRSFPHIPIIVMTAYATPEMSEDFLIRGVSGFVEKPLDMVTLDEKIRTALQAMPTPQNGGSAVSTADNLLGVLRDCETSRLDGEVVVRSGSKTGRLFYYMGQLAWVVASTVKTNLTTVILENSSLRREDLQAVYEECKTTGQNFGETIVKWGLLDRETLHGILREHISTGLAHILSWRTLEVMFLPGKRVFKSSLLFTVDEVLDHALAIGRKMAAAIRPSHTDAENSTPETGPEPALNIDPRAPVSPPQARHLTSQPQKGERDMSDIKAKLESLKAVDGFIGAAAFTAQGEMLAEITTGTPLDELGALANDVLLKSQKTTDIMGVGRGNQIHVTAPKANILVRCLNENTDFAANEPGRAHVHAMLILEPEGNIALGKMRLEKVIQEIAPLLR